MLIVPVSNKKEVELVFDLTGEAKGILSYHIRKVKVEIPHYSFQKMNVNLVTEGLRLLSSIDVPYMYENNTHQWIIYPKRVNGFDSIGFLQKTVDIQHHQIMKEIRKHNTDKPMDMDMTMYVDVIY
ncbi:hypothetical protein [Virgibacillus salinus]|uniref:Uncharacterized protein n=1 Tax=Virgibacillus salinus TaxID=553311 RepID=A0A1H0XUR3_9BACI|nr:hypothetical protein [Virgibacillus salinus]SDQ06667.1 hypothetical protein SAMN05216231_0224 [Virgibacillus salinus]